MSFSTEVKNELSREEPEKKCCQLAEIAGFIRASGSLRLAGGGKFTIVVSTDNAAVARHYKRLIAAYFRVNADLEIADTGRLRGSSLRRHSYMLTISSDQKSEQILRETGILLVREGDNYLADGIYDDIVGKKCDRRSYLRGIFLGAGSVADPDRSYHLEIVCATETLALDLKKLIHSFVDLEARIAVRRGKYVLYMKSSQYIRDTLALMGAGAHVLDFENTLIRKQMINKTVRITNCDSANTDRVLDASERQQEAIRSLIESGRINELPDKLREAALLRLENPEASLSQLGEMLDPPLGKSGMNGRLKKLLAWAAAHSD